MTDDDRTIERAARSWLEVGPTAAPPHAVEAALLRIETTPQERDFRAPWRLPTMTTPTRVAVAAVIGVLAIGGTFYVANRPQQPANGGPPSATPSLIPSATPSARVDYSDLPGRILVEHLGNAIDLSEVSNTDYHAERRRFYFMDPSDMTSKSAVEFLPGQPATGKSAADISSDGKKIVFQDWTEQTRLFEANLDGTGFRQIPGDCTCALLYPDYDPTATKIVDVRMEGRSSWLEIRDVATGAVTKLDATVGPAEDAVPEQPAWSPDGKTIAFNRITWGPPNFHDIGTVHFGEVPPAFGVLSLLDVATGKVTDLPIPPFSVPGDANWSPDSATIVFALGPLSTTAGVAVSIDRGIYSIGRDGTDLRRISSGGSPEFFADGEYVLFKDFGGGAEALTDDLDHLSVMAPDGSGALPVDRNGMDLTDGPQGFSQVAHWIPNP
jgi:hypothetical protein